MSTYHRLAGLPLRIDSYELEGLEKPVSSGFTRASTVIRLRGDGEEGIGEDVTYSGDDQHAFQEAGPVLPLAGSTTLDGFSQKLEELDVPGFRRWGFESAALDLALRQARRSLADAVGRSPRPVTFVVSLRLGDPPSVEPVRRRLDLYPGLRFKLDPTSGWDDGLVAALAETGTVDSVDLKGAYRNTPVDQPADPALYRLVAEGFPQAWIEDPNLNPETEPVLAPHRERITWDAPIHSVADIETLPFPPRTINVKPSRFGSLRALCEAYDYCDARGIGMYGGGQFELGPGRSQIQHLASLFHPDTPNDVAPVGYHDSEPAAGLPTSPLPPPPPEPGFR